MQTSNSSFTSSFADADDHTQRNSVTEDRTVHFIGSLVRTIINRLSPGEQSPDDPVVEYRFSRQLWKAQLDDGRTLSAVDDGGVDLRRRDPDSDAFLPATSSVALLEAKPRMFVVEDGQLVISDRHLAQMTAEALASRLAQSDSSQGKLSSEQYVCILFPCPEATSLEVLISWQNIVPLLSLRFGSMSCF